MKPLNFMSLIALSFCLSATFSQAAEYFGNWTPVISLSIRSDVLQYPMAGSTAREAIQLGQNWCRKPVQELARSGLKIISYRGTATANASGYGFDGNCDVQFVP